MPNTTSKPVHSVELLTEPSQHRELERLRALCRLMDEAMVIPGTNIRVGLDSIAGLVPVVGDALTAIASAYIIQQARQLGARRRTVAKMCGNVALDVLVGSVPLLGDIFDVGWKANTRNLRLLERELGR